MGTGSMKGAFIFWPQFQNGIYPTFDFSIVQELKKQLPEHWQNIFTISDISMYNLDYEEPEKFKRESKGKSIEQMKVKQWGSKNSQLRLDKATARNAKKMNKGGTARYY